MTQRPEKHGRGPTLRLRLLAAFCGVLFLPVFIALLFSDAPIRDELLIFGWTVLLGIVVSYWASGVIARPIEQMAHAAERAAAGDADVAMPTTFSEEFETLAAAVKAMRAQLSRQRADVTSSRDEVRASVRRLGEVLLSTHDLMKLLSVVLETALVAVQGKAGAVYLMSARRSELLVKVGRGLESSVAERTLPVGTGLAGWVAEHRAGARTPGGDVVAADPEPIAATALAVPLESQSQLMGVLAIYGRTVADAFRGEDLETIVSLARQAGVGIENVLLHQEAQRLSITDGLTGIWNHRYYQMQIAQDFERAIRFGRDLSLLMIDIDDFKLTNDRHGHQRGDSILIELARRIVSHTRSKIDTLARYGGEEFVLVLPETGSDGARIVAEKILTEVARTPFGEDDEAPVSVTVSIGYAMYPTHGTTPRSLLQAADLALYQAKARGKNCVVGATAAAPAPDDVGETLAPDRTRP